jgi:hypothetical protein
MNNRFDELTKSLARSLTRRAGLKRFRTRGTGMVLTSFWLMLSTSGQTLPLGPLVELSRPNAVGTCDSGFHAVPMSLDDGTETSLAVNPANPNNVVAAWIQGPFQNIVAAASFDGGTTWQRVPVPFTTCSGGPFPAAGDPWLSFTPDGSLYCIALAGPSFSTLTVPISKSTDGGLHWSVPVTVDTPASSPDKTTITADPADSRLVYATWVRQPVKNRSSFAFSRTSDAGVTWEPARTIFTTSPGQQAFNPQVLVLPNGTLVEMFYLQFAKPNQSITQIGLELRRSRDKGLTWSAPNQAVMMQTILRTDGSGFTLTVDPDNGQLVRDTTNPSFAVDGRSGNLYAVWEDGRFSNFQYNDVAFSMSSDGGVTWSPPIRINQTPQNIPPLNRQAFYPVIAVARNGTIAVTYYDFRLNTPDPGVPTDYWMVQCHPSPGTPATNPANWGNEVRLTSASFDLEALPVVIDGFWFGDYLGLASVGGGFVSTFGAVDQSSITSIFYRRVGQ